LLLIMFLANNQQDTPPNLFFTYTRFEHNSLENTELVLALANNSEIDLLSKYCKRIISIKTLYVDGDKDIDNYYRIYRKTISYLKDFKNISLLVAGHPRFGVTLTQLFEIQASKENYILNVNPGISSLDTMLIDLKIDPLERGSVIIDVNRLLLFEHPLNTALDYFIYHISSIGNNRTDFMSPSLNNQGNVLKDYLLKFYPQSKEIVMIESASTNSTNPTISRATLGELAILLQEVNFTSSLFIKGDINRHINHKFYNALTV
ncbi:methylase, partial [Legionella feeleii]